MVSINPLQISEFPEFQGFMVTSCAEVKRQMQITGDQSPKALTFKSINKNHSQNASIKKNYLKIK